MKFMNLLLELKEILYFLLYCLRAIPELLVIKNYLTWFRGENVALPGNYIATFYNLKPNVSLRFGRFLRTNFTAMGMNQ